MNDVSSFVKTELNETEGHIKLENIAPHRRNIHLNIEDDDLEETVKPKRKRGRPPKPAKDESESDSDKYEYNSEDSGDIEDYDIFDDDFLEDDEDADRKKRRGKKRKYHDEEDESIGFEDLDSSDEKEQILLQEYKLK